MTDWIAGVCDEVLQVNDGGDMTLADSLAGRGVRAIATDVSRGLDVNFALQTYHPRNVLAVNPDDETCIEILSCVSVERFFYAGTDAPEAPEGWTETPSVHGMLYQRKDTIVHEPA